MPHFLIVYDTHQGKLLRAVETFQDFQEAFQSRLALEREHSPDDAVEIVVVDAPSLATVKRTHARYFRSIRQLAEAARRESEKATARLGTRENGA